MAYENQKKLSGPGTVPFLVLMLKENGKIIKGGDREREGDEGHGEGRQRARERDHLRYKQILRKRFSISLDLQSRHLGLPLRPHLGWA